ncbi:MAG: hypothetical protein Q7U60_04200 [Candidatus Methanoperedens sp.]|nr:hypothetical protein [Candidatus Methanoperedens sp.]
MSHCTHSRFVYNARVVLISIAVAFFAGACAAHAPISPSLLREREPRLSATYSAEYGSEKTTLSITTRVRLLDTNSREAYDTTLDQGKRSKETQGEYVKIDLSKVRPESIGPNTYYIYASLTQSADRTVTTGRGVIRNGLIFVIPKESVIRVMVNIPREQAVIYPCPKAGSAKLKEAEVLGGPYCKMWGILVFDLSELSENNYEFIQGPLRPEPWD